VIIASCSKERDISAGSGERPGIPKACDEFAGIVGDLPNARTIDQHHELFAQMSDVVRDYELDIYIKKDDDEGIFVLYCEGKSYRNLNIDEDQIPLILGI
jgi:hypothetical protein